MHYKFLAYLAFWLKCVFRLSGLTKTKTIQKNKNKIKYIYKNLL